MCRGLDRGLGLAGYANSGLAFGQRHDRFAFDDRLDFAQHRVVMVEQLVAVERSVPLQERDHLAIVAGLVSFLSRNQRRQRLHLVADVHVALGRLLDEIEGFGVDAPVPERIFVEGRRQAIVVAGPRQDLGAHPVVVVLQLPGEHLVGVLPALQVRAGQQFLNAADHRLGSLQVLHHLTAIRPDQAVDVESLPRPVLGKFGQGLFGAELPRIFLHAHDGCRIPFTRHLRVHECANAAENGGGYVVVRQEVLAREFRTAQAVLDRLYQDFQILPHLGVRLLREAIPQFSQHGCRRASVAVVESGSEVDDRFIETLHAEARRVLGIELGKQLEDDLRVFVTDFYPAAFLRRRRRRDHYEGCRGDRRAKYQGHVISPLRAPSRRSVYLGCTWDSKGCKKLPFSARRRLTRADAVHAK